MSLRSPSGWMNATDVRSSRTENFLHSCCSTTQQHVFYVQSSVDGVTISVKLWNLSNLHNDKKTQCLKTNKTQKNVILQFRDSLKTIFQSQIIDYWTVFLLS